MPIPPTCETCSKLFCCDNHKKLDRLNRELEDIQHDINTLNATAEITRTALVEKFQEDNKNMPVWECWKQNQRDPGYRVYDPFIKEFTIDKNYAENFPTSKIWNTRSRRYIKERKLKNLEINDILRIREFIM